MPIIENIIEILGDLIGFISDVFTGDWESAWDHLVDYVQGGAELDSQLRQKP